MPNDVNEEAEAALGLLGIIAAPPSTIPAKRKLSASPAAPVANDFFLGEFHDDFMDNARYLITEAYCRIHQRIDIADLSERLNLSRDEGEKWIVNLIRETRMGADAKIDLEKNVIEIYRPPLPMYQTVIEKSRGLAARR